MPRVGQRKTGWLIGFVRLGASESEPVASELLLMGSERRHGNTLLRLGRYRLATRRGCPGKGEHSDSLDGCLVTVGLFSARAKIDLILS